MIYQIVWDWTPPRVRKSHKRNHSSCSRTSSLPPKTGRAGHDYKLYGSMILFADLNLEGMVVSGDCAMSAVLGGVLREKRPCRAPVLPFPDFPRAFSACSGISILSPKDGHRPEHYYQPGFRWCAKSYRQYRLSDQ